MKKNVLAVLMSFTMILSTAPVNAVSAEEQDAYAEFMPEEYLPEENAAADFEDDAFLISTGDEDEELVYTDEISEEGFDASFDEGLVPELWEESDIQGSENISEYISEESLENGSEDDPEVNSAVDSADTSDDLIEDLYEDDLPEAADSDEDIVITIELNGGWFYDEDDNPAPGPFVRHFKEGNYLYFSAIDKTGYVFKGWNWDKDATEPMQINGMGLKITSDMNGKTLHALWAEAVKITFQYNGGQDKYTGEDSCIKTVEKGQEASCKIYDLLPPAGKAISGWKDEQENFYPDDRGTVVIPNAASNMILTAVWVDGVEVTFHVNHEGCVIEEDDEVTEYTTLYAPNKEIRLAIRPYYTEDDDNDHLKFIGWSRNADGTGTVYSIEDDADKIVFSGTKEDLYGVWKKAYRIEYNANGGRFFVGEGYTDEMRETIPFDETVYRDFNPDLSHPDGSRFLLGWSTDSGSEEPVYTAENSNDPASYPTEDLTLFAIWSAPVEEDVITVTLNPNGGYWEDAENTAPKQETYEKGDRISAYSLSEPTLPGKMVNSWATDPDGKNIVLSKERDKDGNLIRLTLNENQILYAVWADAATVILDPNGGYWWVDGKRTEPKEWQVLLGSTMSKTFENPVCDGKVLAGYALDPDGKNMVFPEKAGDGEPKTILVDRDIRLFAIWKTSPETCSHSQLTHIPMHAATCVKDGNIEYYLCAECDTKFKDAEATSALNDAQIIISKTGIHKWNSGTVQKAATEDFPGIKLYTCTVCGKKITSVIPKIVVNLSIKKKPAKVKVRAEKKGKVTLSWSKLLNKGATKTTYKKVRNIEIQFSTINDFATGVNKKVLKKTKTKLTLKLKSKTIYYFRIRYTDGKGGCSSWVSKKVKTK